MPTKLKHFLSDYGFAIASIALAIWVRLLLDPALGNQFPFATIFFAILLTAWYSGFYPSLLAVAVGALSANYFILPPRGSFALEGKDQQIGLALYGVTGLGIAILGGLMHTARCRTELSLEAERRQAVLIDQTHDAVLVWNWDGVITFWNAGAERLYGFPREGAIGQVSHALLRTVNPGGVNSFVDQLERTGIWEGEQEHVRRDGTRVFVESRMVLIRDAKGSYVLEANRDTTIRRRMEDQLREGNAHLEIRVAERTAELARSNVSLQVSEERLRFLIEGVQEYAIFMLDKAGMVVTWNAGAERTKGYRADEIIGRHFSCFYPEEEIALGKPVEELQRALADGQAEREGWRVRKDGSRFWARVVLTTLRDKAGQLRGFSKVTRDITESMRLRERFQQAVESAPNGMVMINSEGTIVLVNAQTERLFGYCRADLLGQPVELLVPERYRTKHPAMRLGFFANPQVRSMGTGRELFGRRKDGSEFPVEIGLNPIKTEEGFLVLSAIVDITERKCAENALRESESRYRFLFERNLAGVVLTRQDGAILDANEAAARLFGVGSREEFLTRKMPEFYFDHADREALALNVIQTGAVTSREILYRRADGRPVWALGNICLVPGSSPGPIFHSTLFDITERKRSEESLQRLNAELELAVRLLGETNRELKSRTTENEAFVYSVSHDLRAPLVNLQGFSKELAHAVLDLRTHLMEGGLPEQVRTRELAIVDGPMPKSIRFIQTAVTRLGNIIDALLRLSRAGRVIYQNQHVDVKMVVDRVVESLRGTASERGVTIQVAALPPVLGDPAAIEQIFANLIANALNYLESARPARIEVGVLDGEPPFEKATAAFRTYFVRDNGMGIAETGKLKVFQPFQRLHPQAAPGEGLGLAIVQRVVERHGGSIWFESTVGQGSTFFVTLPAFSDGPISGFSLAASPGPEKEGPIH